MKTVDKLEKLEIPETLNDLPDWKEQTKKIILKQGYLKNDFLLYDQFENIKLPYYFNDFTDKKNLLFFLEKNFSYISTIGADINHLIDYAATLEDSDLIKATINIIETLTTSVNRLLGKEAFDSTGRFVWPKAWGVYMVLYEKEFKDAKKVTIKKLSDD